MKHSTSSSGSLSPQLPPVAEVLPQKPPMVLLDAVLSHTPDTTVCLVRIGPSSPFVGPDGAVESWVAVEYMEQCAAAHSGLCERELGRPIRLGFLLGSRKIVFHVLCFSVGTELDVQAHSVWGDGEMASFACSVRDRRGGALLVECELSAYSPRHMQDLLQRIERRPE